MTRSTSNVLNDALLDVLDAMEEALVAYDVEGRLIVCNRAFRKMYDYSESQAYPGVHFRELGEIDLAQGNVIVEDEVGPEDYLARKAQYRQELVGSFTVKLSDGRWIRTTDRRMSNGGFVSVQVDVTDLKAAEERSRTDPLTGLLNRSGFYEHAHQLHEVSERYQRGYAIMIADLDNFKDLNDRYGHLAGDYALQQFAERLIGSVRKSDVTARFGGEEFVSLAPETNAATLLPLAERLREDIEVLPLAFKGINFSLTVSVGIAHVQAGDTSIEDVIHRADTALYQAKQNGRNRVVALAV